MLNDAMRAALTANKIPTEQVYRLKSAGFRISKSDAAGRVREMFRQTYANGVTRYERVSGKEAGIVTWEVWGTDLPKTITEVRTEEVC